MYQFALRNTQWSRTWSLPVHSRPALPPRAVCGPENLLQGCNDRTLERLATFVRGQKREDGNFCDDTVAGGCTFPIPDALPICFRLPCAATSTPASVPHGRKFLHIHRLNLRAPGSAHSDVHNRGDRAIWKTSPSTESAIVQMGITIPPTIRPSPVLTTPFFSSQLSSLIHSSIGGTLRHLKVPGKIGDQRNAEEHA